MRVTCKLRRDVLRTVEHCERGKRACCYLHIKEKETLFVSHDYAQMIVVKWPSKARKIAHQFCLKAESVRHALRRLKGDDLLFSAHGTSVRLGDGTRWAKIDHSTDPFVDFYSVLNQVRPVRDTHEICPDRTVRMLGAIDRMHCEWITVASSQDDEPLTITGKLPVKGYEVTGLLMPKRPDDNQVDWAPTAIRHAHAYDLAHLMAGDVSCKSLDILLNLCSTPQIQSFIKLLEVPHADS